MLSLMDRSVNNENNRGNPFNPFAIAIPIACGFFYGHTRSELSCEHVAYALELHVGC